MSRSVTESERTSVTGQRCLKRMAGRRLIRWHHHRAVPPMAPTTISASTSIPSLKQSRTRHPQRQPELGSSTTHAGATEQMAVRGVKRDTPTLS